MRDARLSGTAPHGSQAGTREPQCLFCRLVAGEVPRSPVFENEAVMAFMDIFPVTVGHLLVIPRIHVETLETCPTDTAHALITAVQQMNIAVRAALGCEGVLNEVMNGAAAGQEIFHLHFHVIPRWVDDGFGWHYPSGYREAEAQRRTLDEIAKALRDALSCVEVPGDPGAP